jgi:hypothetical protein
MKLIAGSNDPGIANASITTLKGSNPGKPAPSRFDPFRVGKTVMAFPGALPPAINFVPFRDGRDLLKVLRSLLAKLNEVDIYC